MASHLKIQVIGPAGSGKTAMCAVIMDMLRNQFGMSVEYVPAHAEEADHVKLGLSRHNRVLREVAVHGDGVTITEVMQKRGG